MKKLLPGILCTCFIVFFSGSSILAQNADNLQPKSVNRSKADISKSSSVLSADLSNLFDSRNPGARRKDGKELLVAKNGLDKYFQIKGDEVLIDVTVKEDLEQAKAELAKVGFKVKASFGRVISGSIAIQALPQLETAKNIRFAKPAYKPFHNIKAVNLPQKFNEFAPATPKPVISQGDTAQRSYIARSRFGVKGAGVKVGILSDSYNSLGTANIGVSMSELPGLTNPFGYNKPVEILEEYFSYNGTDEGRGMAEIVHDVAPGAELAFHTAFNGEADFAQGIVDLQKAGCKVINDDVFYYDEPFFQDGIVAQAVDFVKQKGVTYFSSAGNSGRRSYESVYRGTTVSPFGAKFGTAHNFSAAGDPARYYLPIRIPINGTFIASFQWDDPYYSAGGKGAKTDLDFYLLDSEGNIVNLANDDNILSGDPVEIIGYNNFTSSTLFYVAITKFAGPSPTRLKYIDFGNSSFLTTTPAVPGIWAPTLIGHAKAEGAIATAAAPYYNTPAYGVNPPQAESFSSVGGVANYFDKKGNRISPLVRLKPEITAPDGGNTSFFPPAEYYGNGDIPQDPDTYPNFFGTSAAAPHAAGVAALLIEARKNKSYTPDQVKLVLQGYAIDMDDPNTAASDKGFDFKTGMGLIRADVAVEFVRVNTRREMVEIADTKKMDEINIAEVSPNPSTGRFKLNLFLNKLEKVEIQIFDMAGKLIIRKVTPPQSILDINLSDYTSGTYILNIKQGEFSKTLKLIKH